ncbi:MAG: aminoglycoside phosphotransferase family protein [Microbacteriaceae bacterium]|nr:aminoglycoside phosphotransferase family protein [Microbacteriaceae bacterium]
MMHDDQLSVEVGAVRALIIDQFPQWQYESLVPIRSDGTVNAIFRLGENLAVRMPIRSADPDESVRRLRADAVRLAEISGVCPFPTPRPIAIGLPGDGYPMPWSIQTWLPGEIATADGLASSHLFARDLASLVRAFREADTRGRHFTGAGRGGRLADHDEWMTTCFRESNDLLDVAPLRALWEVFRVLPSLRHDVMSHGDLIPANLLVQGERLVGVLDGGDFAAADPALDLVAAWHLLDSAARETLRADLECADLEWQRGAAWAFQQAMGLVWYYRTSNPAMSALGRSTLRRIIDDRLALE